MVPGRLCLFQSQNRRAMRDTVMSVAGFRTPECDMAGQNHLRRGSSHPAEASNIIEDQAAHVAGANAARTFKRSGRSDEHHLMMRRRAGHAIVRHRCCKRGKGYEQA